MQVNLAKVLKPKNLINKKTLKRNVRYKFMKECFYWHKNNSNNSLIIISFVSIIKMYKR